MGTIFKKKRVLWALWGHLEAMGMQTREKTKKVKIITSILTPFRVNFEVLGTSKIALDLCCFLKGSFKDFWLIWEAKGPYKKATWSNFGALWRDKWTCENYAPV